MGTKSPKGQLESETRQNNVNMPCVVPLLKDNHRSNEGGRCSERSRDRRHTPFTPPPINYNNSNIISLNALLRKTSGC